MVLQARLLRNVFLVAIVSMLGAIAGGVFSFLLHLAFLVLLGHTADISYAGVVDDLPLSLRIVLPVVGGLVVGFIAYFSKTPEVYGEGVRRVREAVEKGEGMIRARVTPAKFVATLATLATGGSAGREGPMIMIGAGIGSLVGQLGGETKKDRDRLLLVGVAATIAATFGTPLTAIVLVVELLRRTISRDSLISITTGSLLGAGIARYGFGVRGLDFTALDFVPFSRLSDLVIAALFGLCAGVVGIVCIYGIKATRRLFVEVSLPDFLMPALGGLLVGILSCFTPYLYEPALHPWLATYSTIPLLVIGMVLMLKIAATCITLGSGGSGGVFAPSLMLGAMVAAGVMGVATHFAWQIPGLYMLVAMAGVIAGVTQLPLTAALLLMEASGHLTLLPLLLVATYTAYGLARLTKTPSLYQESEHHHA